MASVITRTLRQHWLIALLVLVGATLRILTVIAYRPAIMFFGDSYSYIVGAQRLQPPNDRPFGYSFVLRMVSYVGDLGLVTTLQHLAGLALAVLLYVVVLRRGAPRWLAALVATPLLLDGYLLQIEHNILSETMFASLLFGAVVIVTRERMTIGWAIAAGSLLSAAALTRTVAIPIAALFVGYLLIRRLGIKVVAGFVLALAIPVLAYMGWFMSTYGTFATTDASGRFLYGRVAVFADCSKATLTPVESRLCDNATASSRPNANFYVWASDSPVRGLGLAGPQADKVASSFSRKIIMSQPLTYGQYVGTDMAHYFMPGKYLTRVDSPLGAWQFPVGFTNTAGSTSVAHNDLAGNPIDPAIAQGPAAFLRGYQSIVYTQGPILLLGLILGLVAGWVDRSRRRWDGPFVALVGLAAIAIPSLTVMFDYRYGLPAIPLLMLSSGIGAQALLRRRAARAEAAARMHDDEAVAVIVGGEPPTRGSHRKLPTPRPAWVISVVGLATVATFLVIVTVAPLSPNSSYETYVSYQAELGSLGPPITTAQPVKDLAGVTVQQFTTGDIVATTQGGVAVPLRFMESVERNGGLAVFGAARTRETKTADQPGLRIVTFDRGWVYWSRLDGARAVTGDIFDVWSPKKVRTRLREPLGDAYVLPEGGAFQQFAGGSIARFADGSVQVTVKPAEAIDSTQVQLPPDGRPASAADGS